MGYGCVAKTSSTLYRHQHDTTAHVQKIHLMAAVVDVSTFLADTLSSRSIQSAVPEVTQREECCMGIDEAGRGPVLGQWSLNSASCF